MWRKYEKAGGEMDKWNAVASVDKLFPKEIRFNLETASSRDTSVLFLYK